MIARSTQNWSTRCPQNIDQLVEGPLLPQAVGSWQAQVRSASRAKSRVMSEVSASAAAVVEEEARDMVAAGGDEWWEVGG